MTEQQGSAATVNSKASTHWTMWHMSVDVAGCRAYTPGIHSKRAHESLRRRKYYSPLHHQAFGACYFHHCGVVAILQQAMLTLSDAHAPDWRSACQSRSEHTCPSAPLRAPGRASRPSCAALTGRRQHTASGPVHASLLISTSPRCLSGSSAARTSHRRMQAAAAPADAPVRVRDTLICSFWL